MALQKKHSVILCKTARLHTQLRRLSEHYALFGEINGEHVIISKGFWYPRSPDLNPCDFYFWGNLESVMYANNPHHLKAVKQNIRESIYNIQQRELQQVSRNLFEKIQVCLTAEGRHFNIFYDAEYNINYYV
jgi:hypothetical protein